jgi:ABC-type transport system involved in multi-copper enzyme maturation permease subunit
MTGTDIPTTPSLPPDAGDQRVTQLRVLRSEWTKLRSVPSTAWSLLATVALVAGIGVLYSLVRVTRPPRDPAALAAFDPTAVSLSGVQLAQLAVGVLGVLVVTGEYATGTVRSSFAAVPRRLPVLWAKAVTLGAATLVLCVPASFAAFLAGQSILSAERLDIGLGAPGVARAVLGAALYLTAVGLLGLGLGALLRSTAGAVAALFGALFGLQLLVSMAPEPWAERITRFLPGPAGVAVTFAQPDPSSLEPWAGLAVCCGWIAVLLAVAAWRLRRRDA